MIEDNAAIDSNLYVRIKALENAENTITKEQMDLKLDKVEFTNFVSMLNESTISPMQKEIDKSKKDITCIEVSTIFKLISVIFYSPSLKTSP